MDVQLLSKFNFDDATILPDKMNSTSAEHIVLNDIHQS
jgi:hypothetical protein